MNFSRARLTAGLFSSLVVIASRWALATSAGDPDGPVNTLTYLEVDSSTLSTPPTNWSFGNDAEGAISVVSTPPPVSSETSAYALEGTYPASPPSGGEYVSAYYNILSQLTTEDIYIEFWAKMPGATGGFKFVKIFGQRLTPTNYADTTFPTDYTGADSGALLGGYFGDGTSITNDCQNVIFYSGINPTSIGRSYGIASVQTPQMTDFPSSSWGAGWHHFRIHVKFDTGTTSANEVPNGEMYFEVDGKAYLDVTGLYNRNPSNGPIQSVEFFGWAQNDATPFQILYDDIRITTGGFSSGPSPDPPTNIQVN